MIRILNRDNRKYINNPIYRTECSACGSIIEYTKDEVHTDRDGSYIVCPVCDMFISHIF